MNGSIQSWLTPALLSAAVVLVGYLLHSITAMRRDLQAALKQLVRHETILQQHGMFEPRAEPGKAGQFT